MMIITAESSANADSAPLSGETERLFVEDLWSEVRAVRPHHALAVQFGPLLYEVQRTSRKRAVEDLAGPNDDLGLVLAVLRVEVRRRVKAFCNEANVA